MPSTLGHGGRAGARGTGDAAAAPVVESQFQPISDGEFAAFSTMIGELAGIVIKDHKREMIQSRLARRLRALRLPSYSAYLAFVQSRAGEAEIGELINAVTTNLTSFFRESHHFDHLRDVMLADMAAQGARRLRIWSSASSSGEEPYSIAMTLAASPAGKIPDARILATDLDTNILARAQAGIYTADRVGQAPDELVRSMMTRRPDGDFEVRANVKSYLTFKQLNLLHDWPVKGPFDIIFCRNVLIYFENDVKKQIVDKMARLIRPDGALYLGHSESLLGEHPLLRSEGKTIYRRLP